MFYKLDAIFDAQQNADSKPIATLRTNKAIKKPKLPPMQFFV